MVFHPQSVIKKDGAFIFSKKVTALAHSCIDKEIIKEFWHNFTSHASSLEVNVTDEYIFSIGNAERISLDGADYSINITNDGIFILAKDEKTLLQSYMTLLDQFKVIDDSGENEIFLSASEIRDKALVQNRMIHFCVFPETKLWELQKFLRFTAALKFTHAVIEFWGMLQFDCMKELGWKIAYSKDEVRPIINEARELGLEIVPMFNHWGHAPLARQMQGKHVVLDQNLSLVSYFIENGWCWNIKKEKVRSLFREVRNELIELCGEGKYFHIGCDEADGFGYTKEEVDFICDYLNEISKELSEIGRRPIVWGDMFLFAHEKYNKENRYVCHAPTAEIEKYMHERLSKNIVIADWQYDAKNFPVETSLTFKEAGFDTLVCPWDEGTEITKTCIDTAKRNNLFGFMHTTWHTLSRGIHHIPTVAIGAYEDISSRKENPFLNAAYVMRRVYNTNGDYEKTGWGKKQIDDFT